MTEHSCHAHVRPPAPDVEPPPPTLPVRSRDLVRYRALLGGYNAYCEAQAKHGRTLTFDEWSAGVAVTLDYLRRWDRRQS